jgi:GNAT superfamily N-acetyltransferase
VSRLLDLHLARWLGQWPPTAEVVVATAPSRVEPGWDGRVQPVVGVASPDGTVVSVPPQVVEEAQLVAASDGFEALAAGLGPLLGRPGQRLQGGVFRWADAPPSPDLLPDAGVWLPFDDPRVPDWLHPFGGEVLVALVDGTYAAGVGVKRHDEFGHELAVGTDERFRGLGLARRLVAQAARRVIADGRVPTYLHDPSNVASAKVADAAGFPDQGWKILGLWS